MQGTGVGKGAGEILNNPEYLSIISSDDIKTARQVGENLAKWCEENNWSINDADSTKLLLQMAYIGDYSDDVYADFNNAYELIERTGQAGADLILSYLGEYGPKVERDQKAYLSEKNGELSELVKDSYTQNGYMLGVEDGTLCFINQETGKTIEVTGDAMLTQVFDANGKIKESHDLYNVFLEFGDENGLQLISPEISEIYATQAEHKRLTGTDFKPDGVYTAEQYLTAINAENQRIREEHAEIALEGQKFVPKIKEWAEANGMVVVYHDNNVYWLETETGIEEPVNARFVDFNKSEYNMTYDEQSELRSYLDNYGDVGAQLLVASEVDLSSKKTFKESLTELPGRLFASVTNTGIGLTQGAFNFLEHTGDALYTMETNYQVAYLDGEIARLKSDGHEEEAQRLERIKELMQKNTMAEVGEAKVDNAYEEFFSDTRLGQTLNEAAYSPTQYGGGIYRFSQSVGETAPIILVSSVSTVGAVTLAGANSYGANAQEMWSMNEDPNLTVDERYYQGTTYATYSAMWDMAQWAVGFKLNGTTTIAGSAFNASAVRVGTDVGTAAADPYFKAFIAANIRGTTFSEEFESRGGVQAAAMNAALAGLLSGGSEVIDLLSGKQKQTDSTTIPETPDVDNRSLANIDPNGPSKTGVIERPEGVTDLAPKVDLAGTVKGLAQKIDLTGKVEGPASKIDLTGIFEGQASKIDLTGILEGLAQKIDLTGKVEGPAQKIDLTGTVKGLTQKIDLTGKVEGPAQKIDLADIPQIETPKVEIADVPQVETPIVRVEDVPIVKTPKAEIEEIKVDRSRKMPGYLEDDQRADQGYQELCEIFFGLAKDDETRRKLERHTV